MLTACTGATIIFRRLAHTPNARGQPSRAVRANTVDGPALNTGHAMNISDLERRCDGPIPARELDAAKYPTKANQIERAKARVAGASRHIHARMAQWRSEVTLKQNLVGYRRLSRMIDPNAIIAMHMPRLKYWRRARLRWQRHLAGLEAGE